MQRSNAALGCMGHTSSSILRGLWVRHVPSCTACTAPLTCAYVCVVSVCCRTVPQAQQLARVTEIQLALNLSLRHEVLVEKCCGRRICSHCGKNYNIADIYLPADGDRWVIARGWL